MPPRDVHPLEYASGEAAREPRMSLFEWGVFVGIIAIGISLTFGADEGADGYVRYLYPMTVPVLDRVFGRTAIPDLVLFAACVLYWPMVGAVAQCAWMLFSRWRRRDEQV